MKETANVRDVLEICRHHEALCRVSVAMNEMRMGCGWPRWSRRETHVRTPILAPSCNGVANLLPDGHMMPARPDLDLFGATR